jgi:hypothetical protein
MPEYSLIPTKTLKRLERLCDMLEKETPAKVELLGKKAAQQRFGWTDGQWYHNIRTLPPTIVKRQGNGAKNCGVKIDAQAYVRQYQNQ